MIQHLVGHVRELHGLPGELAAADAEEHLGVDKHLQQQWRRETADE